MSLNAVVASTTDYNCDESYFSKYPCDECGDTLSGDRYDISYRETLTGPIYQASVCIDCYVDLCG